MNAIWHFFELQDWVCYGLDYLLVGSIVWMLLSDEFMAVVERRRRRGRPVSKFAITLGIGLVVVKWPYVLFRLFRDRGMGRI